MSLFQSSAETAKQPRYKVAAWGPPGAGKTHWMMGAPRLALVDLENRARNFAARGMLFQHAEVGSLKELGAVMNEIRDGKLDCESIAFDSGSAIYLKLIEEHTRQTENGAWVTDWPLVNRRFFTFLNLVFEIHGKNVLFSMHAATKLVRQGRDFRVDGLKFVGDDRFRYGFDFIFRIEPKGDPTKHPAIFHVEKTSSPNLHVGQAIPGLTWPKFVEIVGGKPEANPAPAERAREMHDDGTPISSEQLDRIEVLQHQLRWSGRELGDAVKIITRKHPMYRNMTAAEASRLIAAMEQRAKGAA